MEHYEFPIYKDRDVAIVEFTVRALANPDCKDSKEVLEAIREHRNKLNAQKH